MAALFWDASALGKRYASETGSAVVNSLWTSKFDMVTTIWGYAEVYAILVRRHSSGRLDSDTFAAQVAALQNEVLNDATVTLLTVDDVAVLDGLNFIRAHSLNVTDAALLCVLLKYIGIATSPQAKGVSLVSADRRLIRAATAEGVATINPETASQLDVNRILSAL